MYTLLQRLLLFSDQFCGWIGAGRTIFCWRLHLHQHDILLPMPRPRLGIYPLLDESAVTLLQSQFNTRGQCCNKQQAAGGERKETNNKQVHGRSLQCTHQDFQEKEGAAATTGHITKVTSGSRIPYSSCSRMNKTRICSGRVIATH